MSYSIYLKDERGEVIELEEPISIPGSIYAFGGSTVLTTHITYNYASHFYNLWPEKGIRFLYGQKAQDTIDELKRGIDSLDPEDCSGDYWHSCEDNAREALKTLLELAETAPDGVWNGD